MPNKAAIFLQKAMLTAINRKVKNMAVLELKRKNPKIMDQIKEQYNTMIFAFEQAETLLINGQFRADYHVCIQCNKVIS